MSAPEANAIAAHSPAHKQSRRPAYSLLIAALLLGAAAGVAYFVPIPWLTVPAQAAAAPSALAQGGAAQEAVAETSPAAALSPAKAEPSQAAAPLAAPTRIEAQGEALRRAAAMYAAMPPFKAAPLIQALDLDMAVQVLRLLNEDEAGAIVMYMDTARGAEIMKQFLKATADTAGAHGQESAA